jgi:hypothetical protein
MIDSYTLQTSIDSDKQANDYDCLCRIWPIFDTLNDAYEKHYNPSEHLVVGEVTVKFKGRVIFRQYIPTKQKRFGIRVYKFSMAGYTYSMKIYLGKDKKVVNQDMTHMLQLGTSAKG